MSESRVLGVRGSPPRCSGKLRTTIRSYAMPRDLPESSGFDVRPRQAIQANEYSTPSSINAPGKSVQSGQRGGTRPSVR
jgi:hypothetical protein